MSVQTMAAVWRGSQHSGSALLMMLAIADFSDDKGVAYPAVSTLAEKTRMKPRNAHYLLTTLQESGELVVKIGAGPRGTNLYRIALDRLDRVQPVAGVQGNAGMQHGAGLQAAAGMQPSARGGATGCANPLHPIAPEPSLNHQEPSGRSLTRPKRPKLPVCPHDEIVDAYHEILPELPRALLMEAKGRKEKISDFWGWVLTSKRSNGTRRAETPEEAIAFIRTYFERARSNDFIMNRGVRSGAHAKWRADLEYVIGDKGRVQVIERTEVTA
ncbi:helix-turn-helix domain-containing protein [Rhizobacter sp. SG703]|uniref:helix-turn-helix domain-containing protein n=1 Tax=Rhizobacter sp. SG703 TaxID=2587140 RepID=UPI0014453696|nr:helix-turn-helix domain-containing protein [Rhizobacter sp. SG703]NKI96627.1 hypothetical protein [Rhizobacter sp. SG703]